MSSQARDYATGGQPTELKTSPLRPTHLDLEAQSLPTSTEKIEAVSPVSPTDSVRFRKVARSNTAKTYRPDRRGQEWLPGSEPGIDVSSGGQPRSSLLQIHEECEITIVDFAQDDMKLHHLDNCTLANFLTNPRPVWSDCRWINVNGLSWDVIEILGKDRYLHRLAIEDLMNPRNRTKADWYSDHTFIVLPLQKLIHYNADSNPDSDSSEAEKDDKELRDSGRKQRQKRGKRRWWPSSWRRREAKCESGPVVSKLEHTSNGSLQDCITPRPRTATNKTRTLQRYLGGPNQERIDYMEKHSALAPKRLAVGVEQVSIFLTSDNTVISFFESSADDVETPLIRRLNTPETILRRSSDASMICQAIIDAIIDLSIPVATAYQDVAGELELNVLTEADVRHASALYVLTSEIVSFRSNISPIVNLVNALRDHKPEPVGTPGLTGRSGRISSSVTISATAQIYFRDVEDHCVLLMDGVDQMRRSADNMIDLIFNTNSARQNESMKQLTLVTILFLPLTFLTGYFGMNFEDFTGMS
ncbi:uncharacterized protein KY384_004887 [Bacidia gigantensis]|uniref:uncharacterized protein n=1 Tax=Bacidia gigantensis TaxID=2732470 RepID=UPI001D04ADB8|nr:uncharacterized protein KY384_004887 [Bacidia gigantensis]KAG8530385.1 hypothetical protein KY384_004887 [Bacidia gigantensis]